MKKFLSDKTCDELLKTSFMVLNKSASRKLLVFLVASLGFFTGQIDMDHWTIVAGIYVGAQGLADFKKTGV